MDGETWSLVDFSAFACVGGDSMRARVAGPLAAVLAAYTRYDGSPVSVIFRQGR
jgi:hypothetical protein